MTTIIKMDNRAKAWAGERIIKHKHEQRVREDKNIKKITPSTMQNIQERKQLLKLKKNLKKSEIDKKILEKDLKNTDDTK